MEQQEKRKSYRILRTIRSTVAFSLGGILANSYFKVFSTKQIYDGPLKQACVPGLNCHACPTAYMSCPIGIIQAGAAQGWIPFSVIGYLGTIGMIFGRSVCGWLCPFGWLQDQMFKIKSKKVKIPAFLKNGNYVSLVVLAIILPALTEAHWFSRICPWGTMIAGIPWVIWNPVNPMMAMPVIEPGMVGWLYAMKIVILMFFLIMFVLTKRPFCRTLCPLGAIYAQFNRVSYMRMQVEGRCVGCDLCVEVCPVDIKISDDPNSPDCIRCLKCTVCKNVHVRWGLGHDPRPEVCAPAASQS
ncbi:MAG: 4Fe-4S binding protein [bacterium]